MAELLKKKIHLMLGEYGSTPVEDFGVQLWGIPRLDCSSEKWPVIWELGWEAAATLSQNITWAIRYMFNQAGITLGTQPTSYLIDPWLAGTASVLDLDDYEWYSPFYNVNQYIFYHQEMPPGALAPRFIFEDDEGNALNWGPAAQDTLWYNGTATTVADGRIMPYSLGFIGSLGATRAGLYFTAITSDDKFLTCSYYYDKGNSRYTIKESQPLLNWINGLPPYEPPDPYDPGGTTGPGGGTGVFTRTTTPIDFPGEPTLSATDTGFVTLFNPSVYHLQALANYMWASPSFDPATWRKLLADPMDAILGLSIVPVAPDVGPTPVTVTVGNISTNVSMPKVTKQYKTVDCGTLEIPEYWGAYLDYDPYTKLELYLPYCGTHAISADDCMGKVLHLKYIIDLLSGACCAMLKCGDSVLYTFTGQCAAAIPVTGRDWTNIINGVMSAASSVGSMVATGGVGALSAVGGLASAALNVIKPHIEKSGNMGGTGGLLGPQIPYIILTQPRQAMPGEQHKYTGYPSFITRTLGNLAGYTEVEVIHLEGIPCTGEEQDELATILKTGVIL